MLKRLQRRSGRPIHRIYTDGAPEIASGASKLFPDATRITITKAPLNTPQSNGQAERAIRLLKMCVRVQFVISGLSQRYWSNFITDCARK